MRAMLLRKTTDLRHNKTPLEAVDLPVPEPGAGEVQLQISVCGVCHTELDEIEGRTAPPQFPVVLGHQAVGTITAVGEGVRERKPGERVGVAWVFQTCGHCEYCTSGRENLCPSFQATGRDADGGYAEFMVAPAAFVHPIPRGLKDAEAAPMLCAGAIGYRSLRLSGLKDGQTLGLTGFGASAHLVLKLVDYHFPHTGVFVFARNPEERNHALELGAAWAGDTTADPPDLMHAIIDTTPAWKPDVEALRRLRPGGRLVINAIRKEAGDQDYLQHLDYATHLWMEKEIKSVANVTRQDVREFLKKAAAVPLHPDYEEYPLEAANRALMEMKAGKIRGAKVLRIRNLP